MGAVLTHYPNYDVLDRIDEWDSHTKEIVRKRLGPFKKPAFLSDREARYIAIIAGHIVYENRSEIIDWIVHNFDEKFRNPLGESDRKVGVPPEDILIREGLRALDRVAKKSFGKDFGELDTDRQFKIIADLQLGKAPDIAEWSFVPQKELFKKLVGIIVGAYYSHPAVWSEIGYGGPMYPGIYVRIEEGLTEPWEAKRDGK